MEGFTRSGAAGEAPHITLKDDPRQDALGRLIAHFLEGIIANGTAAARPSDGISRGAVRGLIAIVKKAIGDGTLAEYQSLCREVLARVSQGRRVPRWNAFYDDASAREIRESAVVKLALHLDCLGADADALAGMICAATSAEARSRSIPAAGGADGARILDRLLTDLYRELSTESGRRGVSERYGADTCRRLWQFAHALLGTPRRRIADAGRGDVLGGGRR